MNTEKIECPHCGEAVEFFTETEGDIEEIEAHCESCLRDFIILVEICYDYTTYKEE